MKPKIITVVGGSGSGKGYLTKKIVEALGEDRVAILPHDMYYHPHDTFPRELHGEFHGHEFQNFDHPDALETELLIEHIYALKNGNSITLPTYDFGNNPDKKAKRGEGEVIEPKEFIIIDGIFSLHEPLLRKLSDVKVFITCPSVTLMARRLIRDWGRGPARGDIGQEGLWDDILFYIEYVQKGYKKFVAPHRKDADIVVSNDEWVEEGETPKMVPVTLNYLKGRFSLDISIPGQDDD